MRGSRSSDALVRERRDGVLERVLDAGEISISSLAHDFSVSEMTIHRDLDNLAAAGLVDKARGRALAPSTLRVQTSAQFRMRAGTRLKQAVGSGALPLLDGVKTVFFDDSTSGLPLLRGLGESAPAPVTVVTNYFEVVRQGSSYPKLRLHLVGGDYVADLNATFGSECVEAIDRWHFDVAVFSVPAADGPRCYHPLLGSVAIKRASLRRADRSVLLLDHTKLGHTGPHHVCDLAEADTVVLDDETDPATVAQLRRDGANVLLAHDPSPPRRSRRRVPRETTCGSETS